MQDFMRLYSGLVERCFMACTNDFTSKALTNNEVSFRLASFASRAPLRYHQGSPSPLQSLSD
jgi:hypothetical protein